MKRFSLFICVIGVCALVHLLSVALQVDDGLRYSVCSALAAIGTAVASGVGSLFSSSQSYKNQKKLLQMQQDYNTQMWNANNEYNTPVNQRKRLEAAGINPALALGGMNAGQAQQASSGSAPQSNFDAGFGQAAMNAFQVYQQSKLNDANVENVQADTASKKAYNTYAKEQALANYYSTMMQAGYSEQEIERIKRDNKLFDKTEDERVRNFKSQNDLIDAQRDLANAQKDIARYDLKFLKPVQVSELRQRIRESVQRIIESQQAVQESKSRVSVNEQQVKNLASQEALTWLQGQGQTYTNTQMEQVAKFARERVISEINELDSRAAKSRHDADAYGIGPIRIEGHENITGREKYYRNSFGN